MTRNEKKIRKALLFQGYDAEYVKWEPIGAALEMCGPSGGWVVDDYPVGYNVEESIEFINKFWIRPTEGRFNSYGFPERWMLTQKEVDAALDFAK